MATLLAQPNITSSHMPKSGDTLRYSSALPTELPTGYESGGASSVWDFSAMQPQRQAINEYFSASKTPYAFYFFGQIGQKTADTIGAGPITLTNVFSFYTNSSKVFKAEGIGYKYSGFPLASMYKDDDEIYQFPLNYGDKDTSTFNFLFSIPGNLFSLVQAGTRINTVDGWGTIKTPFKEYTNCLRIKTFVDEIDTVISQLGKFALPRKTMVYKWLSTNERIPVMEVSGTVNATSGKFTATQVRYRDGYIAKLGTETTLVARHVSILENPVNETLKFSDDLNGADLVIWDVLGKVYESKSLNSSTYDVSGLSAGVYFVYTGTEVLKFCRN